ncbi:MAG: methyltransferase domain-containing protein [Desulfobacteraceae bacterium]|nr:MAG: methyltransferase domain-containing protein [Desulfobacteraceae bacterium]
MTTPEWNPGTLMQASGYYWRTCTLHTGVKLDVFTVIGSDTLTATEVAARIQSDERATATLLNALSALGLLIKTGDQYRNSDPARQFLCKDSERYIGFMIMHHHHLMESWNRMDEAILSGKPTRSRSSFSDEARRESFLMGMFNTAMAQAPDISRSINLDGCETLLDLGGGPGTYAIHFCLQNPSLRATVFDLPTTRPFAEKTIERFSVQDRVRFMPGDFVADDLDDLTETFDAAWLSHILHGEGPEDASRVIQKAARALKPGGRIFIHEFILDANMDGPLFPALFSLNMLVGTPSGQSYSQDQFCDMFTAHGIENIQRLGYVGPTESGILSGTKKRS